MTLKDIRESLRKLLEDGLAHDTRVIEAYLATSLEEFAAEAATRSAEAQKSIATTSESTNARLVKTGSECEKRAPGRDSCRLLRDGVVVTRSKSSLSSLRLVKRPSKAGAGVDG